MFHLNSATDDIPDWLKDRLARAIHERYRRSRADRKPVADPAMRSWEKLPETLKNSNRHQAVDIPAKLRILGYRIAPADGSGTDFEFTLEEAERLAIMEHDRWMAERRADGWQEGPVTDADRKLTAYLVSWDQLPEEIREYDREAVRAIPLVLAEAGYGIYRAS